MESSTRGDVAPGLAPDNGKTPADEIAEAGEAHGASAPGPTTAPHSAREGAQLKNNYQLAPNSMGSSPANSMGSMPDGTDGSARDTSTGHARPASGAGLDHGRGATAAVAEHACQQPIATSWGSLPANSSGSVSCEPEGDAWPMSTGEAHGAHAPGSTTGEGPRQSLQSMACQQPIRQTAGAAPRQTAWAVARHRAVQSGACGPWARGRRTANVFQYLIRQPAQAGP